MYKKFETLVGRAVGVRAGKPLTGLEIGLQFDPKDPGTEAELRKMNAAFLIALSGAEGNPRFDEALQYLQSLLRKPELLEPAGFLIEGLGLIRNEVERALQDDPGMREDLEAAFDSLSGLSPDASALRRVFFPEGNFAPEDREGRIEALRKKRTVNISRLNPSPVNDPAREVLFTSNVLLGVPLTPDAVDGLELPVWLRERIRDACGEEQIYWYDHPIPIGVQTEKNEAVYGLRALDEAVTFEKERGTVKEDAKLTVALSVSVTHRGLRSAAGKYLRAELGRAGGLKHLSVFLFTEADTARLLDEVLIPAVKTYSPVREVDGLIKVFGVDGEYGRHYSFLKSLAALWQVFVNPALKATFKTDLDQVFPQKELVQQTGLSALEHLMTPLWGAEGVDSAGRAVELGLLAGALVNESDIHKSLFIPDVTFPVGEPQADEALFQSALPQALSTEAEMMARYGHKDAPDGKVTCLQRIHVTGGTCGILVDSLRRHRPFTPVFMGRAEDQAYLLSVLFKGEGPYLRYLHKDGLVMRHDKELFAGDAIEAAKAGKAVGDYARMMWFTHYARALPWPLDTIKDSIDPFTGCFVSRLPFTTACMRLSLKAAEYFSERTAGGDRNGSELLKTGTARLKEIIRRLNVTPNPLVAEFLLEKEAWDLYFDTLDSVEEALKKGDEFALGLRRRAQELIRGCQIN